MKKKRPFVPVGNTNRDKRVRQPRGRWLHLLSRLVLPTGTKCPLLSRLPDPGQKGTPFCPGLAFPVGKPGQINVFVVVFHLMLRPNVGGSSGENPIPDVPDE